MKLVSSILVVVMAMTFSVQAVETIVCEGSSTVGPLAKAFAEYFMKKNPDVKVTVSESGSGNGAKAIAENSCTVADMSRPMKEAEFKNCALKGIMPVAHVVALDGIAIVVHNSNKATALTLDQVRDIYMGKITDWSQVGGSGGKIVIVTRDTNSGTYETFNKMVMRKEKIAQEAEVLGSNGAVRDKVSSTPAAVGYVGLGFVKGVKNLTIDGIKPSVATIRSGEYPIARPLFMYTNKYPKMGTPLYRFVTTYLSEDGQEIVEEKGFVPVTDY